jgi:hypothetical protein
MANKKHITVDKNGSVVLCDFSVVLCVIIAGFLLHREPQRSHREQQRKVLQIDNSSFLNI